MNGHQKEAARELSATSANNSRKRQDIDRQQQQQHVMKQQISSTLLVSAAISIVVGQLDRTTADEAAAGSPQPEYKCRGSYRYHEECTGFEEGDRCTYGIDWEYRPKDDSVDFNISADNFGSVVNDRWIGVGFTQDPKELTNVSFIFTWSWHSWASNRRKFRIVAADLPKWDTFYNGNLGHEIKKYVAHSEELVKSFAFNRKMKDLPVFGETRCAYFVYPHYGGQVTLGYNLHDDGQVGLTPSEEPICIGTCDGRLPSVATTTKSVPGLPAPAASSGGYWRSTTAKSAAPLRSGPTTVSTTPNPTATSKSSGRRTLMTSSSSRADTSAVTTIEPLVETSDKESQPMLAAISNKASQPSFSSEPSDPSQMRWLVAAGFGLATLLAVAFVSMTCFMIYKYKQNHKRELYRQHALKQRAYLHLEPYLSTRGQEAESSNGHEESQLETSLNMSSSTSQPATHSRANLYSSGPVRSSSRLSNSRAQLCRSPMSSNFYHSCSPQQEPTHQYAAYAHIGVQDEIYEELEADDMMLDAYLQSQRAHGNTMAAEHQPQPQHPFVAAAREIPPETSGDCYLEPQHIVHRQLSHDEYSMPALNPRRVF